MQDIGQPQGHWVIRFGIVFRTQVLLIFILPCEGSIVKQTARWQPMPYGSSTQRPDVMKTLGRQEIFLCCSSLETKTFSPEKPSNSIISSLARTEFAHPFPWANHWHVVGYIYTSQAHLRVGVESGSPQTRGDFLKDPVSIRQSKREQTLSRGQQQCPLYVSVWEKSYQSN